MNKALSEFGSCPDCKTSDYIIFEGCDNCGYKNRFADRAIAAIPGSVASIAAWETMFMIEQMARRGEASEDRHSEVHDHTSEGSSSMQPDESSSPDIQTMQRAQLHTAGEVFDYLISMREDHRSKISGRRATLKASYREAYDHLFQTIPPEKVAAFIAFNDLEDAVIEMQNKAMLVQSVLTAVASMVELEVHPEHAGEATRRFLSVVRADTKEFGESAKDLFDALSNARRAIFHRDK